MKHLFIYTIILFIVMSFIIYKMLETITNALMHVSNSPDRFSYQLNIFFLERLMLEKLKL